MPTPEQLSRRIAVARGDAPADVVLRGGRIADVFTGVVRSDPADIAIVDGMIAGVGAYGAAVKSIELDGLIVAPALIESHIHVESTLLAPAEFARVVASDGTGTVVADPHEVANVCGAAGVEWMRRELRGGPADVRLQASPCVPATPLATTGGALHAGDVAAILASDGSLGLAEVMDFPGAVGGSEHLLDKIAAASGRPVDGHCPGLTGLALQAYAALGISSDHESTTVAEAREKVAAGIYLMARSGSTAEDLDALLPLLVELEGRRCLLVNDDVTAVDLLRRGNLTEHLRRCVAAGMSPVAALRMVTLNAAEHFGLSDRGAVAPGRRADFALFEDLVDFRVAGTWHSGRDVTSWPAADAPEPIGGELVLPATIDLDAARERAAQAPAIGFLNDLLLTERHDEPDAGDALLLCIDRYAGARWAAAHVRGFGITSGAIATTVAHDHHNLMILGRDPVDMALAVELARGTRGGLQVISGGAQVTALPLDLAGLMSSLPAREVADRYEAVRSAAHALGCSARDPLMALSFLGLEVIPQLKLTDHGLVDVLAGRVIG